MGFLDNLFGGQQSPAEMELVQMLGGDPEQMRRNARRNGMLSLASALLGAGGENGVQSTGRALAQFGMSGRGMAPEMDRLMQAFQMRQQIKDLKAGEERKKSLLDFVSKDENFAGVPEQVRGIVQLAAKNGNFDLLDSFVKESFKQKKPAAVAGGSFMARAAAQLGFDPNDASTIPRDRLDEVAQLAQTLSLEAGRSRASNTTVKLPPQESKFQETSGEESAKRYFAMQDAKVAADETDMLVDRLEELNSLGQSGKWEQARAKAAQWFPSVGGDYKTYQEFLAASAPLILRQAQLLKPASNIDLDFVTRASANFGNDPEVNKRILGELRKGTREARRRFTSASDYMDKHNSLQGWRPPDYVREEPTEEELIAKYAGG